jgi:hypothetical protein
MGKPREVKDLTVKWRDGKPPYVEIRWAGELVIAGWVHPTPEGPGHRRSKCVGCATPGECAAVGYDCGHDDTLREDNQPAGVVLAFTERDDIRC